MDSEHVPYCFLCSYTVSLPGAPTGDRTPLL
eukprot:gene25902-biopygen11550